MMLGIKRDDPIELASVCQLQVAGDAFSRSCSSSTGSRERLSQHSNNQGVELLRSSPCGYHFWRNTKTRGCEFPKCADPSVAIRPPRVR